MSSILIGNFEPWNWFELGHPFSVSFTWWSWNGFTPISVIDLQTMVCLLRTPILHAKWMLQYPRHWCDLAWHWFCCLWSAQIFAVEFHLRYSSFNLKKHIGQLVFFTSVWLKLLKTPLIIQSDWQSLYNLYHTISI